MSIQENTINLLLDEYKERPKTRRLKLLLRRTSILILIVYLIGFFSLLGINLYLANQAKTLQEKKQALSNQIKKLSAKEEALFSVKQRIKVVQSIFADSTATPTDLVKLSFTLALPGVQLDTIEADKTSLEVGGTTVNSAVLVDLFKQAKKILEENNKFVTVELSNLTGSNTESYQFLLNFK